MSPSNPRPQDPSPDIKTEYIEGVESGNLENQTPSRHGPVPSIKRPIAKKPVMGKKKKTPGLSDPSHGFDAAASRPQAPRNTQTANPRPSSATTGISTTSSNFIVAGEPSRAQGPLTTPAHTPFSNYDQLGDDSHVKSTTTEMARIHGAMNSMFRPVLDEKHLDDMIQNCFHMIFICVATSSVAQGGSTLHSLIRADILDTWSRNREALANAFAQETPSIPHSSIYLDGGSIQGHVYRGQAPHTSLNMENVRLYASDTIQLCCVLSWEESIRQGSMEFYDRQLARLRGMLSGHCHAAAKDPKSVVDGAEQAGPSHGKLAGV